MSGSHAVRGRLAPTTSGPLHLGHARTFQTVAQRCREVGGTLILRIEDIDPQRCRPEYEDWAREDLSWLGLTWDEGPDLGGPVGPYRQSERLERYRASLDRLREAGLIYPCRSSRKDILAANPRRAHDEAIFPVELRPPGAGADVFPVDLAINWRFRVPEIEQTWTEPSGRSAFTGQADFGDFLVWRKDGVPAYELAVVVDDIAMGITQVVRGEDLRLSTARQLLLFVALGATTLPTFEHLPLVNDLDGQRLSKTAGSLGIRELRRLGFSAGEVLQADPAEIQREVARRRPASG